MEKKRRKQSFKLSKASRIAACIIGAFCLFGAVWGGVTAWKRTSMEYNFKPQNPGTHIVFSDGEASHYASEKFSFKYLPGGFAFKEFSESYIDLYSGNERNLEVILKFENEDKLEFENITIKRSGAEVDTVESEDVLADLGFRLHFFNDAYNEDGSFYEEYLPDDYDRLMKAHKEYSKKYEDVEIDVNSPFEEEKEEEQPVDPNKEIEVFVDGKKLQFDVEPIIVDDRTLVPMRAIFENLGAKVEWFGDTRTVTAKTEDVLVSLQIGSNVMYKNNIPTELEVPAMLHNSRTLVPLRAVSEAFGKTVDWDAEKRTVTIY